MPKNRPSRSAHAVAVQRAAHQILDVPILFEDPLALRILGPETESVLRSNSVQLRASRNLRAAIVARSKYAEEELAHAIEKGVRQYVILGAGLDTFAYRTSPKSDLHIFEVDTPVTQAWKLERLRAANIPVPDFLSFVPIDFENQSLNDCLCQKGFRRDEATFFSFLGVAVLLKMAAVMETMKFVASLPAGSAIVFDYGIPHASLNNTQKHFRTADAIGMASLGEPLITFFDPTMLANELEGLGFTQITDSGYAQINDRYFKDRADGLCMGESGRRFLAAWK